MHKVHIRYIIFTQKSLISGCCPLTNILHIRQTKSYPIYIALSSRFVCICKGWAKIHPALALRPSKSIVLCSLSLLAGRHMCKRDESL
jgi:hypothetical protein